jgi:hypothetical protein
LVKHIFFTTCFIFRLGFNDDDLETEDSSEGLFDRSSGGAATELSDSMVPMVGDSILQV